jgi:hypothetical protein
MNNIEDLTEVQGRVYGLINDYYKYEVHSPADLIKIARELSINLFYLASIKAKVNKAYEAKIYGLVHNQNLKVNAATNEAAYEYPQLYTIRQELTAGNKVVDIIRSEISLAKTELSNAEIA